jgi:hypothetical protein
MLATSFAAGLLSCLSLGWAVMSHEVSRGRKTLVKEFHIRQEPDDFRPSLSVAGNKRLLTLFLDSRAIRRR